MRTSEAQKQLKTWIRSQHLICEGTDFIFETVDQSHVERFEQCMMDFGGYVREVRAVGNWPMGPSRSFKILRAIASIPRPGGEELVHYWASRGGRSTRFSEINH